MAKKEKQKKGFSIYALLGKIGDILLIPIIIISLFSSVSMLVQRNQNKPTTFFGCSLVNILSSSMVDDGFLKGDTVITKSVGVNDVALGDVIAFYHYYDIKDNGSTKHIVMEYNYIDGLKEVDFSEANITIGVAIDSIEFVERNGTKTVEDAQKAKATIYFHRVIGIYLDDFGNVFYKTKGSNNTRADGYVRSDFVVGEYISTPRFLRDSMSFCASTLGMIVLVCLPLSALVLMQCFSLIKQIETMSIEKQLILGRRRFDEEDIIESFDGDEMETHNKVFLYYLSTAEERNALQNFMWGKTLNAQKISRKDQKLVNTMLSANEKLNESDRAYWQEWLDNTSGYTRKKIQEYYEEVSVYNVLNDNKEANSNVVNIKTKQPLEVESKKSEEETTASTKPNATRVKVTIKEEPAVKSEMAVKTSQAKASLPVKKVLTAQKQKPADVAKPQKSVAPTKPTAIKKQPVAKSQVATKSATATKIATTAKPKPVAKQSVESLPQAESQSKQTKRTLTKK